MSKKSKAILKHLLLLLILLPLYDRLTMYSVSMPAALNYMGRFVDADCIAIVRDGEELCRVEDTELGMRLFDNYITFGAAQLSELPYENSRYRVFSLLQTKVLFSVRFYRSSHYIGTIRFRMLKDPKRDALGQIVPGYRNIQGNPVLGEIVNLWNFNPKMYSELDVILDEYGIRL